MQEREKACGIAGGDRLKQKKSVEDYLKTIYVLYRKKDVHGLYKLPMVKTDNRRALKAFSCGVGKETARKGAFSKGYNRIYRLVGGFGFCVCP